MCEFTSAGLNNPSVTARDLLLCDPLYQGAIVVFEWGASCNQTPKKAMQTTKLSGLLISTRDLIPFLLYR